MITRGVPLVLAILLSFQLEAEDGPITQYLQSLERVNSYDAIVRVEQLVYPDAHKPEMAENAPIVALVETNRDVFAWGRGRRIERNIGNDELREIAAIEWSVAVGTGKATPSALSYVLPGLTYYEYLNPVIEKSFLSTLLQDSSSAIRPVSPSDDGSQVGFDLQNKSLRGPVRFWLDPRHGYLPAKVETYQKIKGQNVLVGRMQVENFVEVKENAWVPAQATVASITPGGPAAGREYLGFSMRLDAEQSSWNSINDNELFTAQGIPKVNHEDRGWRFSYPEVVLPAVKRASEVRKQVMSGPAKTRVQLLIALMALPLLAIGIAIFRKKRAQRVSLKQ